MPDTKTNVNVGAQTVGLFTNSAFSDAGLTLYDTMLGYGTYLLDNQGRVVNSWTSDYTSAGPAYLLANGDLLRTGIAYLNQYSLSLHASSGGMIEEYDWAGNLVWSYEYIGDDYSQHHDVCVMPGGNILIVSWKHKSSAEAMAAGRDPATLSSGGLLVDSIAEIQKTGPTSGVKVWEWHAFDHLIQDINPGLPNYGVVADHPERIDINYTGTPVKGTGEADPDWTHVNAVDYDAQTDRILISVHTLNEVWVIDHSTTTAEAAGHSGGNSGHGGDLLYRFGNPQAAGAGDASDQLFHGQHDAQWIAEGLPGAGDILVFDNGWQNPDGEYSHVLELRLPVDEEGNYLKKADGSFADPEIVWTYPQYDDPEFYSAYVSGAQRLPSGNTLVTLGASGTFEEVDTAGNVVWKYVNPDTDRGLLGQGQAVPGDGQGRANNVFRAVWYGYDFTGFLGKDLTAGRELVSSGFPGSLDFSTSAPLERQLAVAVG
ncbi:aryl-sulfate sulfotransferase [Desulfovibrio sp. JY]|nr:aryl-sulfate sulfotransferase [Desulfovibrio sp. JY]